MALPGNMKAVVFDGPYKVSIQSRPVPTRMPIPMTSHPQFSATVAEPLCSPERWGHPCQSARDCTLRLVSTCASAHADLNPASDLYTVVSFTFIAGGRRLELAS